MLVNAKEYLEQASKITIKLKAMSDQLAYLKSAAEYISPSFDDMPHSSSTNVHKTEDSILCIISFKGKMEAEYKKLQEVNDTVNSVSDPELQQILVKRYIGNKKWKDIAHDLFICERQVRRLHEKALSEITRIKKLSADVR